MESSKITHSIADIQQEIKVEIISSRYNNEVVANSCSISLCSLSTSYGLPIIFGVLTVENMEQAIHRADPNKGDKGGEAAYTAIEMVQKIRTF